MHTKNTRYSVGCLSSRIFLTSYILPFKFPAAAAAAVTTNCTMSVLIFTSIHNILQPKEIGDEEPYYSTKISIFSFIWAGLSAYHKASTL